MPKSIVSFTYYLDAARYCREADLPLAQIVKHSLSKWLVLPMGS